MADREQNFTVDLSNVLKHVKKEKEDPYSLTQPCEEQDFKMPIIKTEKIDEEEPDLYTQQSESYAETANVKLEHQDITIKQETETSDLTDSNQPWSLASGLLAVSMKTNNSLYPVPVIKSEHTSVSEMSESEAILKVCHQIWDGDRCPLWIGQMCGGLAVKRAFSVLQSCRGL
ncbi:uncharacterized protein LOC106051031 isoform X2 [Biomphalaria glabrata]|uniref:Uncharacterized protein LOC106051031 isoform X2 n=1 Tax=Biomphalaria glabrata TaxID=6526 RepID=A0A9W3BEA3_BIOGL|nr:uncharacterized protein LOC106051031 isoform X2 [Biomphalaria glabrata]